MGIPIKKIRRSHRHLIFVMGILYLERRSIHCKDPYVHDMMWVVYGVLQWFRGRQANRCTDGQKIMKMGWGETLVDVWLVIYIFIQLMSTTTLTFIHVLFHLSVCILSITHILVSNDFVAKAGIQLNESRHSCRDSKLVPPDVRVHVMDLLASAGDNWQRKLR